MPSRIQLEGGQPQKPVTFGIISTPRFYSGYYTNRSPLRDATTTRIVEKFYGAAGDGIIAGLNTEISNRLTLVRRPGNSVWNNQTWNNVLRFYEFQLFSSTVEQIRVLVDQTDGLYEASQQSIPAQTGDAYNLKNLIFTKSTGAGQTFAQGVGNTLYFGNGVDQKKWLQSLYQRTNTVAVLPNIGNNVTLNTSTTTPYLTTYLIDSNNNIQQLLAQLNTTISNVTYNSATPLLTLTVGSTAGITVGNNYVLYNMGVATWLNGMEILVVSSGGTTVTATLVDETHATYASTPDSGSVVNIGGNPVTGGSVPVWNTVIPSAANNFQGGITIDGTVVWVNRGNPLENWGIQPPTTPINPSLLGSSGAWQPFTYYSLPGVVIDSNSNIWSVQTSGKSGTSNPFPGSPTLNQTVTDNGVTWKCIQLAASTVWAAHQTYPAGQFIIASASGKNCLFQLQPFTLATIAQQPASPMANCTTGDYVNLYYYDTSSISNPGIFTPYPASAGGATAHVKVNSLLFNIPSSADPNVIQQNFTLNSAGEITGVTTPFGQKQRFSMVSLFLLNIPVAGNYTININHDDGMFFGIGAGTSSGQNPAFISGPVTTFHTNTAMNSYTTLGGIDQNGNYQDVYTISFPAVDTYPIEIDYFQWEDQNTLSVLVNGFTPIPVATGSGPESMSSAPIWPGWGTTFAPSYPSVTEQNTYNSSNGTYSPTGGAFIWNNLGPVTDFVWKASETFTLANSVIIDTNANQEAPYEAGFTGASNTVPTWATGINQLTKDSPNLIWINQGPSQATVPGTVSTFNGGWEYSVALVNTLDNTVSNATPVGPSTGNFINAVGISIPPGAGLPPVANIDPQCDYVAIFRTTDGGPPPPLLIAGNTNSFYTIPLVQYLTNGFVDSTPDVDLDELLEAPINGENTPPPVGAINLVYHLNRIFFSVGNTVYWTTGPDAPIGNGLNGVSPLNFDGVPSLVERIVPTAIGAIVITVSDVYIIPGLGIAGNPIQAAQPYEPGIGVRSYNAVDINGSLIGMFTADSQFVVFDPSAGVGSLGQPIGDKLRQQNGLAGTNWIPSNVYVAWYVNGEDQAWYVEDGQFGWYRLMTTPSPESGITWSPFAGIVGGCKAVQNIEVYPGIHRLLIGPYTSGQILQRDLSTNADNSNNYSAYAVIGSILLVNPGQIALVQHIVTDSVKIGTPLTLGVVMDEALPYYTGPFELLKDWETDPPDQPKSTSILGQRFYTSEVVNEDFAAMCRHMQILVSWNIENFQNELLTLNIIGALLQEQ